MVMWTREFYDVIAEHLKNEKCNFYAKQNFWLSRSQHRSYTCFEKQQINVFVRFFSFLQINDDDDGKKYSFFINVQEMEMQNSSIDFRINPKIKWNKNQFRKTSREKMSHLHELLIVPMLYEYTDTHSATFLSLRPI